VITVFIVLQHLFLSFSPFVYLFLKQEYLPSIYNGTRVDHVMDISQREAEETMRAMARLEGIFAGVSSGGSISAALRLSSQVDNAVIVAIVCDRGDRYLSTGCFSAKAAARDPQPCPYTELGSATSRMSAYPGPHYVLFTSGTDEATGRPWCGDCDRALAGVREAVRATGGTLLEVEVGPREGWRKDAEQPHPLRTDPLFRLTGVPTLFRWDPRPCTDPLRKEGYVGPVARLGPELEKAGSEEEAGRVAAEFVERTRGMC
jgi:hypothetical protein